MATCAIRSQFGFVHIGVARSAKTACTSISEARVAADAFDPGMLPLESKSRLCMLEGSVLPHLPGIRRMTGFTAP
jgi:hypothetical protein